MIKITLFLTKLYMCDWTQPHKDMPVIRVISGNIYSNVFPPYRAFPVGSPFKTSPGASFLESFWDKANLRW